ncbi:MAG: proprotein convertase P-domain-containing protein [Planctomycetaceae bacterium]
MTHWLNSLISSRKQKHKRARQSTSAGAFALAGSIEHLEERTLLTIDFNFIYGGAIGSGIGFEDATQGQARRDALEATAATFGSFFDETGTIDVNVTSYSNSSSTTLASAGSSMFTGGNGGFSHRLAATKILTGLDLNEGSTDAFLSVNWAKSFELASDFQAGEYDFTAVIMHELSHALGFSSMVAQDGTSQKNDAPLGFEGEWAIYDKYLSDSAGNSLIDPVTYILDSSWDTLSVGGTSPSNGLFFNGYNAMLANGGAPVGLYTPTTWKNGSSVSHLDTDNPSYTSLMMSHSFAPGLSARTFDPIEVGIWMDLGFNMTGISNSAPVGIADSGAGFETDEDTPVTLPDPLLNDFDPDPGESETIRVASVDTTSTSGTVTVYGSGIQTNFSSTGPFVIPAASQTPNLYDLNVTGLGGTIRDVNVNLNIEHDYTLELTIAIISPSGTRVELIKNRGNAEDNFTNTILNDEALLSINEQATSFAALSPYTGSFRPQQSLSALDGQDPNGTWQLEIKDPFGNSLNPGSVLEWSLDIISQSIEYDPNGQFEYLGVGQQATDTFTYTIADENGNTSTSTVTVTINGAYDPVSLPYTQDFEGEIMPA